MARKTAIRRGVLNVVLVQFFLCSGHGKVPTPTHQKALGKFSRNQGSELSSATIVLQGNVVADITRSEDKLNLIPGNAAGTTRPEGIAVCYWSTRKAEG